MSQTEHGGTIDYCAVEEIDGARWLFQMEVVSPYNKLSNIEGYNIDCTGPITGCKTNFTRTPGDDVEVTDSIIWDISGGNL